MAFQPSSLIALTPDHTGCCCGLKSHVIRESQAWKERVTPTDPNRKRLSRAFLNTWPLERRPDGHDVFPFLGRWGGSPIREVFPAKTIKK